MNRNVLLHYSKCLKHRMTALKRMPFDWDLVPSCATLTVYLRYSPFSIQPTRNLDAVSKLKMSTLSSGRKSWYRVAEPTEHRVHMHMRIENASSIVASPR